MMAGLRGRARRSAARWGGLIVIPRLPGGTQPTVPLYASAAVRARACRLRNPRVFQCAIVCTGVRGAPGDTRAGNPSTAGRPVELQTRSAQCRPRLALSTGSPAAPSRALSPILYVELGVRAPWAAALPISRLGRFVPACVCGSNGRVTPCRLASRWCGHEGEPAPASPRSTGEEWGQQGRGGASGEPPAPPPARAGGVGCPVCCRG